MSDEFVSDGDSRQNSSCRQWNSCSGVPQWPRQSGHWRSIPTCLQRWRREFRQGPGNVFPGQGKRRWEETCTAELERQVGRQTREIDFLKGCWQHIEQQRKLQATAGKPLSATRCGNPRSNFRWLNCLVSSKTGRRKSSGCPVCPDFSNHSQRFGTNARQVCR